MRVSRRRLTIRQNPNKIDAVVFEPCMIAEAPGIALALSLPERLGIAGSVVLQHINTSAGLNTLDPLAIVASLVYRPRLLRHLEGAYEASFSAPFAFEGALRNGRYGIGFCSSGT